jgi:hypothetical protein
MGHIKVARWTYYTGNFQKQTFIECDRPDKRRVSYKSRRPWCDNYSFTEAPVLWRPYRRKLALSLKHFHNAYLMQATNLHV